MKVVQMITFTNKTDASINEWLSKIPAEDIVSVQHRPVAFENVIEDYITIFYKTELPQ